MGASGLGSLLVKEGFLTEQDRQTITKTCGQGSWAFAKSIVAMGLLDEDELAAFFAERTRYQIAPKDFLRHLDQETVRSFDKRLVQKLEVIPLKRESGKITVGVIDPLDRSTLKQLEFFTGLEVNPVVVPLSQLYEGLSKIDPDFRRQPTALTHFLQNHAQSAWVRQKLETEKQKMGGFKSPALNKASDDELFEEITEVDETENHPIEVEELEHDDSAVSATDELSEFDFANDLDEELKTPSLEEVDEDLDPFGGTASSSTGTPKSGSDSPSLSEGDMTDELDAALSSFGTKSEDEELGLFSDGLGDEPKTDLKAESPKASNLNFDSDDVLEEGPQASEMQTASANVDDFSFEGEAVETTDSTDMSSREEEFTVGEEDDLELGESSTKEVGEFSQTSDDTKPRAAVPKAILSSDLGGFQDDSDDAIGQDILDSLGDSEPSLDLSALGHEQELIDDNLLSDLNPSEVFGKPENRMDGPKVLIDDDNFNAPSHTPNEFTEPGFEDVEETNINLRAGLPSLSSSSKGLVDKKDQDEPQVDDDDIDLRMKPPSKKRSTQANEAVPPSTSKYASRVVGSSRSPIPTAAVNEMILRLSLSFTPTASETLLEEYLPQIGNSGCLFIATGEKQFVWVKGKLLKLSLSTEARDLFSKAAKERIWETLHLEGTRSWTKEDETLKVYREGAWIWAHSIAEFADSLIFRETVESAMNQIAAKIPAK